MTRYSLARGARTKDPALERVHVDHRRVDVEKLITRQEQKLSSKVAVRHVSRYDSPDAGIEVVGSVRCMRSLGEKPCKGSWEICCMKSLPSQLVSTPLRVGILSTPSLEDGLPLEVPFFITPTPHWS